MPKIKQKTAGKIGLFSAVMVIFGAVVGIGIFFKNFSVFKVNNGNWLGVLIAWIIAIVMVLCMAISFGEIVTCKTKTQGEGLGGWAARFCGYRFGRFSKLMFTQIYYPVLTFAILFFAGEAALNIFGSPGVIDLGKFTTLYIFLLGGGLFALFIILNYISSRAMTSFGNVVGIMKFIPLLAVAILGITFGILNASQNGAPGLWGGQWWGQWSTTDANFSFAETGDFSVIGMIASVPAILFAFEGYIVIGNVAKDMDKPERNVPLSIILAIAIISTLNLAITIGCMCAGTGNVYHLMNLVFMGNENLANIGNIIMSVFICVCIIGVLNAMVFSGMRAFQNACEDNTLYHGKALASKKPGKLFAGAIYFSIMVAIWYVGIGVPSILLNSDAIPDACSNILIIMTYLVYGSVVLGGFVNRFTNKVQVTKIKAFPVTAVIGVIACFFVFAFSGIYQNLADPIMKPFTENPNGWGLFVQSATDNGPLVNVLGFKHVWLNWQEAIVFWSIALAMVAIPFINDALIKKYDYENPTTLIWQKPLLKDLVIEKVSASK